VKGKVISCSTKNESEYKDKGARLHHCQIGRGLAKTDVAMPDPSRPHPEIKLRRLN